MPRAKITEHKAITPVQQENRRRYSIQAMAACGATPEMMAEYLNMPVDELNRDYGDDVKNGKQKLRMRFEVQLATHAASGDVRCLLAWLKQYSGWTEVTRKEITGANGGPISFGSLDAASLDRIIIALRQAEAVERGPQGGGISPLTGGRGRIIDMESLPGTSDEGSGE